MTLSYLDLPPILAQLGRLYRTLEGWPVVNEKWSNSNGGGPNPRDEIQGLAKCLLEMFSSPDKVDAVDCPAITESRGLALTEQAALCDIREKVILSLYPTGMVFCRPTEYVRFLDHLRGVIRQLDHPHAAGDPTHNSDLVLPRPKAKRGRKNVAQSDRGKARLYGLIGALCDEGKKPRQIAVQLGEPIQEYLSANPSECPAPARKGATQRVLKFVKNGLQARRRDLLKNARNTK